MLSDKNGPFINLLVAPTSFIVRIKNRLEYTVSRMVLLISVKEIIKSKMVIESIIIELFS